MAWLEASDADVVALAALSDRQRHTRRQRFSFRPGNRLRLIDCHLRAVHADFVRPVPVPLRPGRRYEPRHQSQARAAQHTAAEKFHVSLPRYRAATLLCFNLPLQAISVFEV